jgi:hypothetical protein
MDYDIETTALVHALEDRLAFARTYVEDLTPEELDKLTDALDKLASVVDQVGISRMEHNR